MINYETIIGIEVHVELNTKHKIFSPSLNDINALPNTNVHPIDLGLPGTLPCFNEEVLKKAIMVAHSLNMDITKEMHWDRKNYFYPDNPKGYQITQQETPIGRNGYIMLDSGKKITVDFMHMEEDTAKSFHRENSTLLDFNRCGVPLVEIVSGPDMSNGKEAREYVEKLRETLLFIGASDCKMNEGSLRVDVNVSIRPYGQETFNTKVEIKNLNSFANVETAIELEVKNQLKALNSGVEVVQATKRFNEQSKAVDVMRIKESQDDYRYFPEPDLPWIILEDMYIDEIINTTPLLPIEIKEILKEANLSTKEINLLMNNREMTMFMLKAIELKLNIKQVFNYLTVNIGEILNKEKIEFSDSKLTHENIFDIDKELNAGTISSAHVKKIIPILVMEGGNVTSIIEKLGLAQITDPEIINKIIEEVLNTNPESIELYKSGKDRAFGFMIGQIMKQSKGQANPKLVNELLTKKLQEL